MDDRKRVELGNADLRKGLDSDVVPSEAGFANLIDSMLNTLDEGYDRTPKDGLQVSQLMGLGGLLSFYREHLDPDSLQWFLELGPKDGNRSILRFRAHGRDKEETREGARDVLTLRCDGVLEKGAVKKSLVGVGINTLDPRWELDVAGDVAGDGWRGRDGELKVPADGAWHDITLAMTGCNVLEIVAGVGAEDSVGKYALLHATAMNTFNSGDHSIDCQQAFFGGKSSRIELRWVGIPENGRFAYKLQMRVAGSYGPDRWVRYQITAKWFDVLMEDCIREWKP